MPSSRDPVFLTYALARAGYGPAPGDIDKAARQGWSGWVEEQLAPTADDPVLAPRLASTLLRIRHGGGDGWDAVDEMRPLERLGKPIEALWPLADGKRKMDGAERRRPRDEVVAATLLAAVHSRWQLKELITAFWHDHFNVDFYGSDTLAATLPVYDREVIRAHALGNFRQFLEAVATSAAMLTYLSNRSSRAGAANENYARELFELHTLGRDAYLNDRYDRWRAVPGALSGQPEGYIDQDVYEAARALTGWSLEDGAGIDGRRKLPESGRFAYVESWHDGYQKRVLATEFQPFAAAMADGRQVLDLVAAHPATARHLAGKLCQRLVGGRPPRLVAAAAAEWSRQAKAPDQIARVVRLILLSPEFAAARGAKVRRPLAVAAGFARAAGIDLLPTEGLVNAIAGAGQRLFGWPTPTGLPDEDSQFLGAQALRQRWALTLGLAENWWGCGNPTPPAAATFGQAVSAWQIMLLGAPDPEAGNAILAGLGWSADQSPGRPGMPDTARKLNRLAALTAMAPAFHQI